MENNSCVSAPTPGLSNLPIPPKGGFEAKNCVGVPEPIEHCMARSNTALFECSQKHLLPSFLAAPYIGQ